MGLCAAQQQLFTVQLAIVQKIYRNLIKKVSQKAIHSGIWWWFLTLHWILHNNFARRQNQLWDGCSHICFHTRERGLCTELQSIIRLSEKISKISKVIHTEMSGFVDKFTWIGCHCVNFLTIKEFYCIEVYKTVNSEEVLEDFSILNSRTLHDLYLWSLSQTWNGHTTVFPFPQWHLATTTTQKA